MNIITVYTSENIGSDIYRVTHQIVDESEPARYFFHKMGEPGHRIVADAWNCNCKDAWFGRSDSPAYQCKHMRRARELDSRRRIAIVESLVAEITGEHREND